MNTTTTSTTTSNTAQVNSNKRKSISDDDDLSTPNSTALESSSPIIEKSHQPQHPPPMVALPPPLMQYPNGQIIYQQAPYYHPMYHQQPVYYSPHQHPFVYSPVPSQISPALAPRPIAAVTTESTPTTTTANQQQSHRKPSTTPHILPKNPDNMPSSSSPLSSPAGSIIYSGQPPPLNSPYYSPYHHPLQMSPGIYPATPNTRNNSISSSPGLGPTATTADQREKARKVSHSAIERRRRERINDKILKLKQIIPSCAEQDGLHKMSILQSAIDYISYLQGIIKTLDEESGSEDSSKLLKGDHLVSNVKAQKSMLPKEVEPFTNQFSIHPSKDHSVDNGGNSRKVLKPMDVIQSGTTLSSNTSHVAVVTTAAAIVTATTPLTPPQEIYNNGHSSPRLLEQDQQDEEQQPSTASLPKPEETKHMSLRNILC